MDFNSDTTLSCVLLVKMVLKKLHSVQKMHNGEISIQVQYTSWDQFRRQVEMEVYRYTQEKNNTDNSPFLGGINIADLPFKIKEIENRRVKYETITQENFFTKLSSAFPSSRQCFSRYIPLELFCFIPADRIPLSYQSQAKISRSHRRFAIKRLKQAQEELDQLISQKTENPTFEGPGSLEKSLLTLRNARLEGTLQ